MLFLSDPLGPFPVGTITFVARHPSPRQVGSIKLRGNDEPALRLEEVAFTAYYPADVCSGSTRKGLDWVLRPLKETLHGFVRFTGISAWVLWPIFYLFGSLIKIPVYPNAPLERPNGSEKANQWPLVIFSHGLGGSRTAYSQICSRLASSGRVVLAMEHRDGTGCTCIPRVRREDGSYQERPIFYYKDSDVIIDTSKSSEALSPLPLRTDQLEFRREEIYTAYQAFGHFLRTSELDTIDNQPIERSSWSYTDPTTGKGPVRFNEGVILAGHSFGGCTILSILSSNPPPECLHIPVTHALIFDPWLEPLPLPGPVPISAELLAQSTPSPDHTDPPPGGTYAGSDSRLPQMLVINSETFTLWKDHYARLEGVMKAWEPEGGRLLTLVASKHETFSDFPILPVIKTSAAKTLMDVISMLSIGYLDGQLEQVLGSIPTREMEIKVIGMKKDGKPRRKLVGNIGDVIVS